MEIIKELYKKYYNDKCPLCSKILHEDEEHHNIFCETIIYIDGEGAFYHFWIRKFDNCINNKSFNSLLFQIVKNDFLCRVYKNKVGLFHKTDKNKSIEFYYNNISLDSIFNKIESFIDLT